GQRGAVSRSRRTSGKGVPILMLVVLVTSSASAAGHFPVGEAAAPPSAVPIPAVKMVSYQSDFAHGFTRGWYVQPGVNAQSFIGLVSDSGTQVLTAQANAGPAINIMYTEGEDWRNMTMTATVKSVNGTILDVHFRQQFIPANQSAYVLRINLGSGQVSLNRSITELTPDGQTFRSTSLGSTAYAASLGKW